ncbi:MAG: hypothetical protein A2107_13435 [Verrucomicrobia bacterium GWF2_62_7]|nr:MAG: hypothetical protein A2107_13435 [Verrucomicrobia bacterium GWF2_62_7]
MPLESGVNNRSPLPWAVAPTITILLRNFETSEVRSSSAPKLTLVKVPSGPAKLIIMERLSFSVAGMRT